MKENSSEMKTSGAVSDKPQFFVFSGSLRLSPVFDPRKAHSENTSYPLCAPAAATVVVIEARFEGRL